MNVSDIPGSVRTIWNAVIPPLFELAIASAVTLIVIGPNRIAEIVQIPDSPSRLMPSENWKAVLDFYGVTTALPLVSFGIVLLVAYAMGTFVRFLGGLVPGALVPNSTFLLLQSVDEYDLVRLWGCHPEVEDLNTLNDIVTNAGRNSRKETEMNDLREAVKFSQDALGKLYDRARFAKGLLALVVLMCVITFFVNRFEWSAMFRAAIVAIAILICLLIIAQRRLRTESSFMRWKIQAYLRGKAMTTNLSMPHEKASQLEGRIKLWRGGRTLEDIWAFHLIAPGPDVEVPKILQVLRRSSFFSRSHPSERKRRARVEKTSRA